MKTNTSKPASFISKQKYYMALLLIILILLLVHFAKMNALENKVGQIESTILQK